MSPIDDELRSLLHTRADALSPAPDPLVGIERRATRMRRNRVAASVAGAALAVTAVAVAVPSLMPDRDGRPEQVATSATPSAGPTAAAVPTPGGSEQPTVRPPNAVRWPTVGGTSDLDSGVRAAWAANHGASSADVTGEVLYRGTTGDKGEVVAYQLWTATVTARVVIATAAQGRALILTDDVAGPVPAFRAIVPGLANPWVAVVADPVIVQIEYAENGVDFVSQSRGRTAVFVRTGPTGNAADQIRTTDSKGISFTQNAAPPAPSDGAPGSSGSEPTNLLSTWPARGGHAQDDLIPALEKAFATGRGRPNADVLSRVLFAGATDRGLRYVFGQTWFAGESTAYTTGYITGGEQGPETFLGPATKPGAKVLAFLVCCAPGASTDTLVVVPQPGTGQVEYAASGTSGFAAAGRGQDALDGVVVIDRNPRASTDRIRLLDGHGTQTFDGAVLRLLCGFSGCG